MVNNIRKRKKISVFFRIFADDFHGRLLPKRNKTKYRKMKFLSKKKNAAGKEKKPRKPLSKRRKFFRIFLLSALLVALIFTVTANIIVSCHSSGRCYDDADSIPHNRVGLVLGTSPKTKRGTVNLYFKYRIEACAQLYHSGKIEYILISGDNRHKNYNEPAAMRNALMEQGVPDSVIVLDYAGFRTYDSMVRAKKVFGQDRLTVISQSWHNERALYIAHRVGINAVGYNARDVAFRKTALKNHIREWFARAKMVLDLIFQHDPHFLGEPIEI